MLDRDEDMMITGHRHPFYSQYKIAYTPEGKIIACEVKIYCNAGYSYDLSTAVSRIILFIIMLGLLKSSVQ